MIGGKIDAETIKRSTIKGRTVKYALCDEINLPYLPYKVCTVLEHTSGALEIILEGPERSPPSRSEGRIVYVALNAISLTGHETRHEKKEDAIRECEELNALEAL